MMISQKQTNRYKGKLINLQSIGVVVKVRKQGWPPTPEDSLVGILSLIHLKHTGISAGVGYHPCFLTFYNYDPYWL